MSTDTANKMSRIVMFFIRRLCFLFPKTAEKIEADLQECAAFSGSCLSCSIHRQSDEQDARAFLLLWDRWGRV